MPLLLLATCEKCFATLFILLSIVQNFIQTYTDRLFKVKRYNIHQIHVNFFNTYWLLDSKNVYCFKTILSHKNSYRGERRVQHQQGWNTGKRCTQTRDRIYFGATELPFWFLQSWLYLRPVDAVTIHDWSDFCSVGCGWGGRLLTFEIVFLEHWELFHEREEQKTFFRRTWFILFRSSVLLICNKKKDEFSTCMQCMQWSFWWWRENGEFKWTALPWKLFCVRKFWSDPETFDMLYF